LEPSPKQGSAPLRSTRSPTKHTGRLLPSPRSRVAPINTPHFPLLRRHCHAAAPSAPPPSSSAPYCLPRSSNRPYPFFRPYKAVACYLLSRTSRVVAGAEPPRPPPSVLAARPHLRVLRPNTGHSQALGEPTDVPRHFPGRERGRLAGIWPAPPPPMAKG
jgi:hypothetical protein